VAAEAGGEPAGEVGALEGGAHEEVDGGEGVLLAVRVDAGR